MVHFNRLKPFPKDIRLSNSDRGIPLNQPTAENTTLPSDRPQAPLPSTSSPIGTNLELVEDDEDYSFNNQHMSESTTSHSQPVTETRRYPAHQRRPPARLQDYVTT